MAIVMDKRTRIALMLGVAVIGALALVGYFSAAWASTKTVLVPKTGEEVQVQITTGTGQAVDTIRLRYTGGPNEFVSISSTDWDESVSSAARTRKLWVSGDWHIYATWVSSTDQHVEVRIELRPGAMSIMAPRWKLETA